MLKTILLSGVILCTNSCMQLKQMIDKIDVNQVEEVAEEIVKDIVKDETGIDISGILPKVTLSK